MGKDKAARSGIRSVGPLSFNLHNNAGNCVYIINLNNTLLCPYYRKENFPLSVTYQGLAFGDV